jgi:hypothetical protein
MRVARTSSAILIVLLLLTVPALASAVVKVGFFGENGWMSDDTRLDTGTDLVGLNYTHAGKPGQTPTAADDAAIAQQIKFVGGPAGSTYGGAMMVDGTIGNSGKSTMSDINLSGFAPASDLVGGLFTATYQWYMQPNPTVRTLALRFGVQSAQWAASQTGFTAIRSGESVWDLCLVHIQDSPVANAWNTDAVDLNTGTWSVYGQATNGNWVGIAGSAPPGGTVAKTLAGWQADATWGPILFGAGSKITCVQFGLGSGQRNCLAYVDYVQASFYHGGDVVDFVTHVRNTNTGEYFATIQEAIDDSDTAAGHTIVVDSGTYPETLVINKAVSILGAGYATTVLDATGATANTAVNISSPGGNVTFDGFKVKAKNAGETETHGLLVASSSPGTTLTVTNNYFEGTNDPNAWDFGIYVHDTSADFVFQHNTITKCSGNTILIEKNPGATDVSFNTFDRGIANGASDAYFNMNHDATPVTSLQRVHGNTIDLGTDVGPYDNDHRSTGVSFAGAYTGNTGGYANVDISDNVFVNLKSNRRGVGLWNNAATGANGDFTHVVISGNTITGYPGSNNRYGIRLLGYVSGATIENNSIDSIDYPFLGRAWNGHIAPGATIRQNSFTNVGTYLDWQGATVLDASQNWWGSNVPATVATKISGLVDYTPLLDSGTDTNGTAPGFQPNLSSMTVHASGSQYGATGRVQEGVDLISGSTIHVLAGLYNERVIVDKSCTILGATAGVSKKGFAVPSGYAYNTSTQSVIRPSAPLEAAVMLIKADNVVVDGLILANEVCQTGGVYQDLIGVDQYTAMPAGSQILNCVLGPNTNTASQDGTMGRCGIAVYGPHTQVTKLTVRGNKIFDSKGNGGGIMIVGPYGQTYHGGTLYSNLFSGSVIEGNEITGNHRSGIEFAGGVQGGTAEADYFMVRDNLVTNNGWFSLADKDNLKYGNGLMFIRGGSDKLNCDAAGTRYMKISGNTISGNEKCGAYIGPMNRDIFWDHNIIQNNGLGTGGYSTWDGIRADLDELYYPSGTCTNYAFLTNIPFTYCSISGNGSMGFNVTQTPTQGPIAATPVWWGAASGPAPTGSGNAVSGNVTFTPWIGMMGGENVVCTPDPLEISIADAGQIDRTTARYLGGGSGALYGFSIDVTWSETVAEYVEITRPTSGPFATASLFQVVNLGAGHKRVDAALGGNVGGTLGPADLFIMKLHGLSCSTGTPIDLGLNYMRNNANQNLSGFYARDGVLKVDLGAPTVSSAAITRTNLPNTGYVKTGDAITLTATVQDACNALTDANIRADLSQFGGGASVAPSSYVGTLATWILPSITVSPDGVKTATITATDSMGNVGTGSATTIVDNTPPAMTVTNFLAVPGHNKVVMTWTNPTGGDGNLETYGLMIRRTDWDDTRDYPTYTGAAPAYPSATGGVGVYEAVGFVSTWTNTFASTGLERDIYAYQAFVFDKAYNYSAANPTAQGMSTNYWLGDVAPRAGGVDSYTSIGDGILDGLDVSALGYSYNQTTGGPFWNPHCDVGPTWTGSPMGLPHPDGIIDFEDLMIFALNYGMVAPLTDQHPTMVALGATGRGAVSLAFGPLPNQARAGQMVTVPVVLRGDVGTLHGIHVTMGYDASQLRYESSSVASAIEQAPHYFDDAPASGKVGLDLALLGSGTGLTGEGVVFMARFRVLRDGAVNLTLTDARLRDAQNRDLLAQPDIATNRAEESVSVVALPTSFGLGEARPNPFNPKTEIAYDMPQAGVVQLLIYDVSGRVVRTLWDGEQSAGTHYAEWDGRDDGGRPVSSGIYFSVMKAEGFHAQKRLTLLK